MRLSAVSSVFVNYRLADAIDKMYALGFEGIDIWCGRPHIYRKDYSVDALTKIRNKLAQFNITPISLMPAFAHYPYSLSSPIDAIREDSIDYMKDCVDNAAVIGAPYVLVVPKQSLYGQSQEDARSCFINSLEAVNGYAAGKGIKLILEVVYPRLSNHMGSSDDAMEAIRELGSDNLGVALDTGHLNLSGEDMERMIKNLGSSLLQVHINDNNQIHQQNAIPGEGNFQFREFINLLRKYQYEGFLSIELSWAYSFDPVSALKTAIENLRGYF